MIFLVSTKHSYKHEVGFRKSPPPRCSGNQTYTWRSLSSPHWLESDGVLWVGPIASEAGSFLSPSPPPASACSMNHAQLKISIYLKLTSAATFGWRHRSTFDTTAFCLCWTSETKTQPRTLKSTASRPTYFLWIDFLIELSCINLTAGAIKQRRAYKFYCLHFNPLLYGVLKCL